MALAAYGGLEAMNFAETKPKELRLGKPCAGRSEAEMDGRRPPRRGERSESNPLARFDEGEGSVCGLPLRCALYSTTLVMRLKSNQENRMPFKTTGNY
jgi:hypothetical protein